MSEPLLEQLFDSPVKVRLLKLFLYHPDGDFTVDELRLRLLASRRGIK
ncbi:hypothetical protein HYW30_01925, partial [Candidatus Azambacteria bacterium]|nr:hypothetical protein [Candidatus Azambacteria bacterium]